MLIALHDDRDRHAVTLNPRTEENPDGYHRLIGGGVELGETHHDAIVREVDEELGATIHGLAYLATVENIFRIHGVAGHEIVLRQAASAARTVHRTHPRRWRVHRPGTEDYGQPTATTSSLSVG